jgi:hypothetical protein
VDRAVPALIDIDNGSLCMRLVDLGTLDIRQVRRTPEYAVFNALMRKPPVSTTLATFSLNSSPACICHVLDYQFSCSSKYLQYLNFSSAMASVF